MLPSFLAQWKMFVASITALALTITPTPVPSSTQQTNATTAVNVRTSTGTSRNWAGYAATSGTFTEVNGTWTVPNVSSSGHASADATWVGIGGIKSSDLIQTGTQAISNSSGQTTYSAFFELLPSVAQTIPVSIHSGDSVTVSVSQQSTNQWQISLKDNTTGQSYQITTSYTSSLSSAEWVEEAPSNGRSMLPLDMFGTIQFSNCSTTQNGSQMNISQANAQSITMINATGQELAAPSAINSDEASFSVTRTSAVSNSPIPEFDRNPGGFRRHGFGIGSYIPRRTYRIQTTITPEPTETDTDADTGTTSARIWEKNPHVFFRIPNRMFFMRH